MFSGFFVKCVITKCVIINFDQGYGMIIWFVANNNIVISCLHYPMITIERERKKCWKSLSLYTRTNDRFKAQLNSQISESLTLRYY
jgi:type IV secretory pathway TrbD component